MKHHACSIDDVPIRLRSPTVTFSVNQSQWIIVTQANRETSPSAVIRPAAHLASPCARLFICEQRSVHCRICDSVGRFLQHGAAGVAPSVLPYAPAAPEPNANLVAAFRKGLSETGYVKDQNVASEFRWAHNEADRLPELAADLVRPRRGEG